MSEYNYQERMQKIDRWRRDAATKNNALEYTTYCLATGIEPEGQYTGLYYQGLAERTKYPSRANHLEFIVDKTLYGKVNQEETVAKSKEIHTNNNTHTQMMKETGEDENWQYLTKKDKHILKFLEEAKLYSFKIDEGLEEKTKLMRKYFLKFQKGQSDDLSKRIYIEEPIKIGRKFNHLYEYYYEQYHPKQKQTKKK